MGYDYAECVVCYSVEGYNEYGEHDHAVCYECLRGICSLSAKCLYYYDKESASDSVQCKLCNENKEGFKFLAFCDNHSREIFEQKSIPQ